MSSYKFGKNKHNKKIESAVLYADKEKVKNLKCKWDNESKRWYILTENLTHEILEELFKLQDEKVIGLIKKNHAKTDDTRKYINDNEIPYFDIGYKSTVLYELYTLEEIKKII
jgi:hypothetical protein